MDPSASNNTQAQAVAPPRQLRRRTPAKSVASVVPISAETHAILKRKTGLEYHTPRQICPPPSVLLASAIWWT